MKNRNLCEKVKHYMLNYDNDLYLKLRSIINSMDNNAYNFIDKLTMVYESKLQELYEQYFELFLSVKNRMRYIGQLASKKFINTFVDICLEDKFYISDFKLHFFLKLNDDGNNQNSIIVLVDDEYNENIIAMYELSYIYKRLNEILGSAFDFYHYKINDFRTGGMHLNYIGSVDMSCEETLEESKIK